MEQTYTVSLYTQKQMMFIKILAKILKLDLILQIRNQIQNEKLPKGKNRKVIGLTKVELGRKTMSKFVGLRAKTSSYLIDDRSEDKAKDAKTAS